MASGARTIARFSGGVVGLFLLFGALFFVQGTNETATGLITQPLYAILKRWGSKPGQITTFVAMLGLPWCLKPIYGLLSDFVPLAGYRRKSYLILMGVVASACFIGLFSIMPLAPHSTALLFIMLLVPTFAVTFADVVLDALIIETGQPRGITGRLQSVRWGAGYTATSLAGLVGGWLCQQHSERWAFLICGALATVALAILLLFVREPRAVALEDDLPTIRATLRDAFRSPTVRHVGIFLFVWHFNPFTQSVLYLHVTEHLRLSERVAEQFYGDTIFFLSVGSIVACISYGFYCRRFSMRRMVPLSIATGVVSTLLYWFLRPEHANAMTISVLVGFTYMTSNLVQCDLAARACPIHAAGTVFGVLMALCNVSTLLSTCVGGYVYEWLTDLWGTDRGFQALLIVGAVCTLASWPAARRIPHQLLPK